MANTMGTKKITQFLLIEAVSPKHLADQKQAEGHADQQPRDM
jgi:hypothetical protein